MGSHPLNLAIRFGLELAALGAFGYWGYTREHPVLRWIAMLALPLLAAGLWVVFAVPDDPSRSGETVVATPGWARLVLELAFFGLAALALGHVEVSWAAIALGVVTLLHYAVSYDRIQWLLSR